MPGTRSRLAAAIMLGGAIGAIGALARAGVAEALTPARFAVGALVNLRRPRPFPAGTFVVNVTGAFALGLLTGLSVTGDALLVLGAGLLGSYTTFSTWMVEARGLGGRRMAVHRAGSMAAGLVAAGAGWITAAGAAAAWG